MTRSDRFALATLLPLLALSAVLHVAAESNSDKSWLILGAQMWLQGKKLYVDVVEINPPLILWLYAIPAWLAEHGAPLGAYRLLGLMGLLAAGGILLLSVRLIRFHPMFSGDGRKRAEFALLLAAIFIFLTPQSYFFDREHILYLMTFPYVLRFAPALARQELPLRLRILTGLCAALGFCIKPHSAILFAAVQLLSVARERSFAILGSVENRIVYGAVALYLFCIWHFTPEYVHAIFPMALATYGSFTRGGSSLLCLPPAILAAGLIFADFRLRHDSPYRRDILYYVGIAGALLVHAIASNGWDYTYHPLMCTLTLLAGLLLYEYQWLRAQDGSVRSFLFGMRGCAICLATQGVYMMLLTFATMGTTAIEAKCHRHAACLRQNPYIAYVLDHDVHSFGTITQDFPKWTEVVRFTGAAWETRFNHLWMLPRLLEEDEAGSHAHAWIKVYVAEALASDLDGNKPGILFVDAGREFSIYPKHVDLPTYFSTVPAFRDAFKRYRYAATIDECNTPKAAIFKNACKYDIYSRTEP